MELFPADSIGVLQKNLDGLDKKHEVMSNNISNADTPGYKRQEVSFRDQLAGFLDGDKNALASTNKRHISTATDDLSQFQPRLDTEEGTSKRLDQNNVDVESEMAQLSKNTLEYRTAIRQLSNQFNRLENVINRA